MMNNKAQSQETFAQHSNKGELFAQLGVGPIPVAVFVGSTIFAGSDGLLFDTSGNLISGSINVLDNDSYYSNCTNYQMASLSNVSLTQTSTNNSGGFSINAFGNVGAQNYLNTGNWTLTYQICDLANPMICSTTTVGISIINTSKMAANTSKITYSLQNVLISPNPSDNAFTIDFGSFVKGVKLELFTIVGQKIYEVLVQNTNEHTIAIDNLQKGTYLLKLSDGEHTIDKKIIKN